jgi:hypothetical protein
MQACLRAPYRLHRARWDGGGEGEGRDVLVPRALWWAVCVCVWPVCINMAPLLGRGLHDGSSGCQGSRVRGRA